MPNTPLGRHSGSRAGSRARRLCLPLAAALLLALAAACGGGDDEEEVVDAEPTPTRAPIPTATPLAATPEPTIIGGDATVSPPEPTARAEVTYLVVPGDTLSAIAQRFGTTVQALMAVNEIADPTLIFSGQELVIPGEGEETPAPASGDGGDGDGDEVDGVSSYIVQPGDTASAIAGRFGVTLAALAEANDTTIEELGLIFVGQELTLPRPP